jgi:hypothetical protein
MCLKPNRTPPFALKVARAYRIRLRTKFMLDGVRNVVFTLDLTFGFDTMSCPT